MAQLNSVMRTCACKICRQKVRKVEVKVQTRISRLGRPWPITGRLAVWFPLSPLKDWWTDSWRGGSPPPCHGRDALMQGTVPPCSLWMAAHRSSVYGICLHECVTTYMCVFNRCQPGWLKSRGVILCISCIYMTININLINPILLSDHWLINRCLLAQVVFRIAINHFHVKFSGIKKY